MDGKVRERVRGVGWTGIRGVCVMCESGPGTDYVVACNPKILV